MRTRIYDPVAVFRMFRFVHETTGANRGGFVDAFNIIAGAALGSSWCASILSTVLFICYQGPAPLPLSASCDVLYRAAKLGNYLVPEPEPGDICFRMKGPDDAEHVYLVTTVTAELIGTISGNTNSQSSANGEKVDEHSIRRSPALAFARLPKTIEDSRS